MTKILKIIFRCQVKRSPLLLLVTLMKTYQKSLKLNPYNTNATKMINKLIATKCHKNNSGFDA